MLKNLLQIITGALMRECKYGENAYQTPAGVYSFGTMDLLAIDRFKLIAGTEMSFNNICDLDRLLQTITHIAATFDVNQSRVPHIAVGVKHGNACGAAVGKNPVEVIKKVIDGDDLALFGGLVITNFIINADSAETLLTYKCPGERRKLDGLIAPLIFNDTTNLFQRKGDKCRLLVNPELGNLHRESLDKADRLRYVRGGSAVQPNYTFILNLNDPDLVKIGSATPEQEEDMLLAKAICDTSNSNTITIVKNRMLIGNGVGQQARVYGAELAVTRATRCGHDITSACAASDSFFPQTDGIKVLAKAGVKAIISTSGSVKDKEIIEFCKEKGIVLYLIPDKKGRGFFGH